MDAHGVVSRTGTRACAFQRQGRFGAARDFGELSCGRKQLVSEDAHCLHVVLLFSRSLITG